jgi:hypothetical protein
VVWVSPGTGTLPAKSTPGIALDHPNIGATLGTDSHFGNDRAEVRAEQTTKWSIAGVSDLRTHIVEVRLKWVYTHGFYF